MSGREFKEEMINKLRSGEAFSLVTGCGNEVWVEAELNSDESISSAQVWCGTKTIAIVHSDTITDEAWALAVARTVAQEFYEREEA